MREQGREGSKALTASFCLKVGSCGKGPLGGESSGTLADLVWWGDWCGGASLHRQVPQCLASLSADMCCLTRRMCLGV